MTETKQLTVNFDNLRVRAIENYDSLVKKLNKSIKQANFESIDIDPNYIQEEMDNLRMLIGAIASVYVEDVDNFCDAYSIAYPNEEDSMQLFNDFED